MTSPRAYRKALELPEVRAELERGRGPQFDLGVLDALPAVLETRPDLATPTTHEGQDVDVAPMAAATRLPSAALPV
ncbi:MAG: hypothetical protein ACR2PL_23705 [Dehalococcoidia bacterium]